jgi:hypothetical protein
MSVIDLNLKDFKRDSEFYGEISLILTVKSFNLQEIRKRYIRSRTNKSGKTGSVERRQPALGGVVEVTLRKGRVTSEDVLCKVKEPRGIHYKKGKLALATENIIHIIEQDGQHTHFTDPWFSYIHTVQFHPQNEDQLLLSSSGFDLIREYDFRSKKMTYEWLAWEHGFNIANDPETNQKVTLTRDPAEAAELEAKGRNVYLVKDPSKDHLPTAKRAAFINSVTYHPQDPNLFLATFFHEGKIYQINSDTDEATEVLSGLKNPHGGHITENNLIATSTAQGEVVVKNETNEVRYRFNDLPGKPEALGELEWIQNTLSNEGLFIAIDSNRTAFVIIDPAGKRFDMVPFDENWAVQDLISGTLNDNQKEIIKRLTSTI